MEGALYSRQWEENEIIVTRIIPPSLIPVPLLVEVFAFFAEVGTWIEDSLVSYCKKFSLVLSELLAHEGLDVV